jgi:cytochrome c oxidase subunit 2
VGRFWSLLFLLVPVLGAGIMGAAALDIWPFGESALAPFKSNHWLPDNIGGREARSIDQIFNFILYLTGAIFVGTGVALFWFLWKYDAAKNSEKPKFMHGSHTLEVVWSIIPAAALLFIAIYQMNTWAEAKMDYPTVHKAKAAVADEDAEHSIADHADPASGEVEEKLPPLARVLGRQFEWRIQYAGKDKKIGTRDDLYAVNELHIPVHEVVVLQIESQDVLHSFFLPNLRVKQDVVPGMVQYSWFEANRPGAYDIVCAELCGWGHYKMRGRLIVEPRKQFDKWYAEAMAEQERSVYAEAEEEDEE